VIEMYSEQDRLKEYSDLGAHSKRGYHLKFPEIIDHEEIADDVVVSRDAMFKLYKMKESNYVKASYIFLEMHENTKKI
jgi:hypothetical protein